jgi:hypothetical protein
MAGIAPRRSRHRPPSRPVVAEEAGSIRGTDPTVAGSVAPGPACQDGGAHDLPDAAAARRSGTPLAPCAASETRGGLGTAASGVEKGCKTPFARTRALVTVPVGAPAQAVSGDRPAAHGPRALTRP